MGPHGRGRGRRGNGRGRCGQGRGQGWSGACRQKSAPRPISPLPGRAVPRKQLPAQGDGNRDEVALLKRQARAVEQELAAVQSRLEGDPPVRHRRVAVVDAARCTLCGICASSCPQDAISVMTMAEVDASRCSGCAVCVYACPSNAIHMEMVSVDDLGGA